MRHDREHPSESRPGADRQLDLFGPARENACGAAPTWEGLPAQARDELTVLMTRLITDHARTGGVAVIGEVRHEP